MFCNDKEIKYIRIQFSEDLGYIILFSLFNLKTYFRSMIIMLIEILFHWTEKYKMKTLKQIYTQKFI